MSAEIQRAILNNEIEMATQCPSSPCGLLIKSLNWLQIGNMTEHENI